MIQHQDLDAPQSDYRRLRSGFSTGQVKAVIFDCFGVLATDGWLPFKEKFFGKDQRLFDKAGELNRQVDAGLAAYADFVTEVAKMAGVSRQTALYCIEHNVPDEKLFEYILWRLKPKYKIGMLSNAGDNWLDEIFTHEQVKLFDEIVLSYQVGLVKPDPGIYRLIAERLGVEVSECIFIDDQERYCKAAREIGMQAIHYQNLAQMKRELEAILKSK